MDQPEIVATDAIPATAPPEPKPEVKRPTEGQYANIKQLRDLAAALGGVAGQLAQVKCQPRYEAAQTYLEALQDAITKQLKEPTPTAPIVAPKPPPTALPSHERGSFRTAARKGYWRYAQSTRKQFGLIKALQEELRKLGRPEHTELINAEVPRTRGSCSDLIEALREALR